MVSARRAAFSGVCVIVTLLGAGIPARGQTTAPSDAAPNPVAAPSVPSGVPPATAPAPEEGRRPAPGTVEGTMQGADIRAVLRSLAIGNNRNIICTKEVSGTVTAHLDGLTFKEALEAVLMMSGYTYREKGSLIYVMTPQQLAASLKAEQKMSVRTFRLAYVTATDAKALIAPVQSPEGKMSMTPPAAVGIAPSKTDTGGTSLAVQDVLVVSDYEENLDRIEKILKEVDVKPDQVLIEATILRATLTENNALGIDFNALSGINFSGFSSAALTGSSAGAGAAGTTNLQAAGTGNAANLGRSMSMYHTGTVAGIGDGGMSFGFFTNHIAMFIKALESVTDVTVVANPKLLIVNKQRGEVLIGDHTGYLTTTTTETVSTQTIQFLDGGTRLIVRPFIARDGYVRMEIHPEDSTNSTQTVGASIVPSQKTTEATSNVLVRDGHTIVIGGLFRESTTNDRTQVPLLGNIPVLGTLFRKTADTTVRDELIILITPRIIHQDNDEAVSAQLKDDVERFRVGQRKGVRWWGRDRLAQAHLRQAKQDLQDDRRACALWNVDMALSLAPRMDEAIRLKERLTEKAFWADESQYSSVQNVIQRMMMNDLGKPVERIVPPGKPRDASQAAPDVREKFGLQPRIEDPLPGAAPGTKRLQPAPDGVPAKEPAQSAAPATQPAPEKAAPGRIAPEDLVKSEAEAAAGKD